VHFGTSRGTEHRIACHTYLADLESGAFGLPLDEPRADLRLIRLELVDYMK